MKKGLAFLLAACFALAPRGLALDRNALLDAAFSMLEEDNIFLSRYNELTGADVRATFPLGVFYLFGGKATERFFSRAPKYSTRECWETTDFFVEGQRYLYGLDCIGFTNWVRREAGLAPHPTLAQVLSRTTDLADCYLYTSWGNPAPDFSELHLRLRVGDLLVARRKYRHVMMYIGTLRDYGFAEAAVPGLSDYLDYPLVIHCGGNPFSGERAERFKEENPGYRNCGPTDGGVCVSILGVPKEAAPGHVRVQRTDYDYFLLDSGYMLTVWDASACASCCWLRMPDAAAEGRSEAQ